MSGLKSDEILYGVVHFCCGCSVVSVLTPSHRSSQFDHTAFSLSASNIPPMITIMTAEAGFYHSSSDHSRESMASMEGLSFNQLDFF